MTLLCVGSVRIAVVVAILFAACSKSSSPSDGGQTGGSAGAAGSGGGSAGSTAGRGGSGSGGVAGAQGTGGAGCWQLPVVNRVRFYPRAGQAAAMNGGKIMGSNESATNGFVELATLASTPPDGQWSELTFKNATAYRYVKYYGPTGSYGNIAELELYTDSTRLTGKGFGTAGSRNNAGNTWDKALDGDTTTYFEGAMSSDQYVGLDLGNGHETAAPTFSPASGTYASPRTVSITSTTAGASIQYTTNGSDPASGQTYSSPVTVGLGTTIVKAIATAACMLPSPTAQATYTVSAGSGGATGAGGSTGAGGGGAGGKTGSGGSSGGPASLHIGNSLTDTIDGWIAPVAQSGGVALNYSRYTIPGAGIPWLWDHPTGGFGVADLKAALQNNRYDHFSVQPFPNGPCSPVGDGGDGDYANRFYTLAKQGNANVQLWVYMQWPDPVTWNDCFANGAGWASPPWNPPTPNPSTWEAAMLNHVAYQEAVRADLAARNPGGRGIYIVPGGLGLINLKHAIESGGVSGVSDFFATIFAQNGTDIHLANPGRWFISLIFYSCMFQKNPAGLSPLTTGLTAAQVTAFETIAWSTVNDYKWSGVNR